MPDAVVLADQALILELSLQVDQRRSPIDANSGFPGFGIPVFSRQTLRPGIPQQPQHCLLAFGQPWSASFGRLGGNLLTTDDVDGDRVAVLVGAEIVNLGLE